MVTAHAFVPLGQHAPLPSAVKQLLVGEQVVPLPR
jgi:hypothetical protein